MQKSQRLIQMIMMINARRSFTVRELADEFGLSTRTITRDLLELSELGIPVYSIQGRGGGYRLLKERLLPPISFTEGEAVAMFFACHSLQYLGSLPFEEGAGSALHKFFHYLPEDMKDKIEAMKEKVMIWSPYRPMSAGVLQTLLQGALEKCTVTIRYRSSGGESVRDIQPIGLYASSGYWYCPAYCMTKGEVRQFRGDRIVSAVLQPDIPFKEEIGKLTIHNKPERDGEERTEFRVSLTRKGVWLLESSDRFAPFIERGSDGSGVAAIPIAMEQISFYSDAIWAVGAEAKVEAPEEAVFYIQNKLKIMAAQYG
ncbi:helix-turn-helix transcriptional regulator [Paenibacillus sp. GCM10027627]|uniref:helix-turn-helix transcriptional regulator n=1 Tax=unclassified Paenibacillus TaxID=185978 RepID=UPI0036394F71